MSTLTDRLREDIRAARTDLNRLEGQMETSKTELTRLRTEATDLGFSTDPTKIRKEVTVLQNDVDSILETVREEVKSLGRDTNTSE